MPETINIVEPTLINEAGHCYSFVGSLCGAGDESTTLRLWVGRDARLSFARKNLEIKKYFWRRIRRLQGYFLYKKLLAEPGKIFIATAGRADLLLLDWAAKGVVAPKKVYLYFHWFRPNDKKLGKLRELARRQPNLEILGPTPSVVKIFQDAGFENARIVPYPVLQRDVSQSAAAGVFRHLLYAGAARRDKGFKEAVDLVACLCERNLQIPVTVQISPEHYGKYDAATRADIERLREIPYPNLQLVHKTLERDEYAALFAGAICLQLYDANDFSDRVSGVTLDAFFAGSPIVTTAGTWMAAMARRFNAGVALNDTSAAQVLSAVQRVIAEYAGFYTHAVAAGNTLQAENSAGNLLKILAEKNPE